MGTRWKIISIGTAAPVLLIGVLWFANYATSVESGPLTEPAKTVLEKYEGIQETLAGDSTIGISEGAAAIAKTIRDDAGKSFPLTVADAADQLAQAQDIKDARRAFKPLSASLIAWLEESKLESTGYQEAYCPMADASWLQKEEEIRNPYLGKKMLNSGEFDRSF
ncbi:MAG TPA: hypothetical protein VEU07_13295 [Candidatus Acidoferrum sp.]|nr:hypothetical protein [Candidatus Acidoferrum sp.]